MPPSNPVAPSPIPQPQMNPPIYGPRNDVPQAPQPFPLDEATARDLVINRFEQSRQAALPYYTRAARYYRLFRGIQTLQNYVGLANLFVPEPYRVVSKKTSKLVNAIKRISVTPETENDKDAAEIGTVLLSFLRRKLGWKVLERVAIQESRIVGMAWLKVLWNVTKETKDKPYMGFDVSFDTVDHVILPPDLTIQKVLAGAEIPWIVHYYETSIEDMRGNPNYNQNKLALLESRTGSRKSQSNILEQARDMFTQSQRAYTIKLRKKFPVIEYYGQLPVERMTQNGQKVTTQINSLVVVADRDIVVRATANPYANVIDNGIPLTPIVARIVGQEMWPIGDLEPAESLFNELNDTRNQRMDTVTLNIDPMKIIFKGANIDDKDLIARRGWIVKSNVPPSQAIHVVSPDMQGVKASIDEEQAIRGDIQQVTGMIDFSPGSDVQAGVEIDTARGAMIAKGDSDEMTADDLDILKLCLSKFYRIVLAYSQEFLDRDFTVRLLQRGVESFVNIDKSRIQGNLDLDIEMQTLQDQTTQQQMSLLLLNQARETPGANVGRFFTDALEALKDGEVQISEYYQPPQPQPEQPKVSVSLSGDLTQMQAAQIYKQIPGVDPDFGDPLMTPEGRQLAKGIHPEDLDVLEKQQNIINSQQTQANQNAAANQPDQAQPSNA